MADPADIGLGGAGIIGACVGVATAAIGLVGKWMQNRHVLHREEAEREHASREKNREAEREALRAQANLAIQIPAKIDRLADAMVAGDKAMAASIHGLTQSVLENTDVVRAYLEASEDTAKQHALEQARLLRQVARKLPLGSEDETELPPPRAIPAPVALPPARGRQRSTPG